jgi:hypothetical protein
MEMILQQVVSSQMRPSLDNFFSYNQIKVKGAYAYKATLITHWGTLTYKHVPFGLSFTNTTFKGSMQRTFNDFINKTIHVYLDDLIIYSKGLSIVSKFQKLWLGPFEIDFVLGINSYILKDLQE